MSNGKAAGPSGIVAEMFKASGVTGAALMTELANALIRGNTIPSDREDRFIINLYKGKRELQRAEVFRAGMVMKVVDRVLEKIICERIATNETQFSFMPGRGTMDAIFILRQIKRST